MGVFKDMGLWYSFPDLQYGSFGPKRALERMPAPGSTPSCGGISRQFAGWFSKTWMILQGLVSMSQCFTSPNYWGYFISNRCLFRWCSAEPPQLSPVKSPQMEVSSSSWGIPNWLVFVRENPYLEMDDDWGYPHDSGNPHLGMVDLQSWLTSTYFHQLLKKKSWYFMILGWFTSWNKQKKNTWMITGFAPWLVLDTSKVISWVYLPVTLVD